MKRFFKCAVLLLAALICLIAVACTDNYRDDKTETSEARASESETISESTSEDWGLGPIMPEC